MLTSIILPIDIDEKAWHRLVSTFSFQNGPVIIFGFSTTTSSGFQTQRGPFQIGRNKSKFPIQYVRCASWTEHRFPRFLNEWQNGHSRSFVLQSCDCNCYVRWYSDREAWISLVRSITSLRNRIVFIVGHPQPELQRVQAYTFFGARPL